jgi:formylmethanofuran dehydrogenase subunit A
MFSTPRYVLKAGMLVVEEGQLRRAPAGKRIYVQPSYDDSLLRDLGKYFESYSAIQLANYPVTGLRDAPVATGAA